MISFKQFIMEDGEGGVPANSVGAGNVAGIKPGETPPFTPRQQRKYADRNSKDEKQITKDFNSVFRKIRRVMRAV
jgi:hypothetical protein